MKNAECVMVNEVKGIPVEMTQLMSSMPHPCTHVTTLVYNMSLLAHCLGMTLLELITICHHCRPQPPYQPLSILTFTCYRSGKNLEILFVETFLFELVIETFDIRIKGVLRLSNLKINPKDVKHIDEY